MADEPMTLTLDDKQVPGLGDLEPGDVAVIELKVTAGLARSYGAVPIGGDAGEGEQGPRHVELRIDDAKITDLNGESMNDEPEPETPVKKSAKNMMNARSKQKETN